MGKGDVGLIASIIGWFVGMVIASVIIFSSSTYQYGSCMQELIKSPEVTTVKQAEALCHFMHLKDW